MTAPEIRATLDSWLWELSQNRTHTPPPEAVALLRQHWAKLSPTLPEDYRPVIDDRLALVDSYISQS